MSVIRQRQPVLKPQDLLVTLKIAVNADRAMTFAELADELSMSTSEVHAATRRAEISHLVVREFGQLRAVRLSLQEFILHGVKYAFPGLQGSVTRGMPTGIAASPLRNYFLQNQILGPVWPDPNGEEHGISIQPLYPSVPVAARVDVHLYEMLVIVDTLRSGAARERELATRELMSRLA